MGSAPLSRTAAQGGAPGWRYLVGRLHLSVRFAGFAEALAFVARVGALADEHDHHPEIDVRFSRVHLAMSSHDVGGITSRDLRLAEAVSAVVDETGGVVDHGRLTAAEIAIDTLDFRRIKPFWRAILGYVDDGEEAIRDPDLIGPAVWFQQLDRPNPIRNRLHLDVIVAHDEAAHRIDAALAAGGRLVSDASAPRFWILADADGNEACVCTWLGRDELDAARAREPTT